MVHACCRLAGAVVAGVQSLRDPFGAAAWLVQALARHGNQRLSQPRSSAKALNAAGVERCSSAAQQLDVSRYSCSSHALDRAP